MSGSVTRLFKPVKSGDPKSKSSGRAGRVVPLKYQMFGLGLNVASRIRNQWAAEVASNFWFTVFKSQRKPWVEVFWQSADQRVEVQVGDHTIPVYLWGQGPLVLTMHGWSGSGTQYRQFIPTLVEAGYQVAAFDAPGHGLNPGKQSHLLEFTDSLLSIQQQIGTVDTVLAHSLGAMAAVLATHRGLNPQQMVLLGPHLDVEEMFRSYRRLLNFNEKLSNQFYENIGLRMSDLLDGDNPWKSLKPEKLLNGRDYRGLLVFDREDEEISQSLFAAIQQHWQGCETLETEGLGHQRILKDEAVVKTVLSFLQRA